MFDTEYGMQDAGYIPNRYRIQIPGNYCPYWVLPDCLFPIDYSL